MARKQINKDLADVHGLLFDHYFPITYERIGKAEQGHRGLGQIGSNFTIICDQGFHWQRREALKAADYFFDYVSDFSSGLVFGVIESIEDNYE